MKRVNKTPKWDHTTLCRYINYKWVSINISYICHVEHHMTPAIDKRGIITYSYHKERTKKKKKVNSQGMGGYHPRFCLIQKYKLHTDLVVWYHTRRRITFGTIPDAGDEQRGMITHSYQVS